MKKLTAKIFVMLVVIFSTCLNAFAATEYNIDEITFYVPEYYTETFSYEDYIGFVSDDDLVDASFAQYINDYETPLNNRSLKEVSEIYISSLYSGPDNFVFDSITENYIGTTYVLYVYGKADDVFDIEAWIYVTDSYLYVFEFSQKPGADPDYVSDIIDSVEILDFTSMIESITDNNDYDSEASEFFEILVLLLFTALGIFLKSVSQKKKGSKTGRKKEAKVDVESKVNKLSSAFDTKFELNGKQVNALNEKIVANKSSDNFAKSELEKERREREKMFD